MRLSPLFPALCLAALPLSGLPAAANDILASAPIDPALFRAGEMRRSVDLYGSWTLVCDTIARLGHRFCSMQSAPVRLGGGTLSLTISTGDDGRPAALLRVPLGLSLPFGIRIKPLGPGGAKAEHHVAVALCSRTACEAVWSLTTGDIAALRGGGLKLTTAGWRFAASGANDAAQSATSTTIDGRGFAAAVAASLQ